jgi:hypothetical protein
VESAKIASVRRLIECADAVSAALAAKEKRVTSLEGAQRKDPPSGTGIALAKKEKRP